jgi:MFS family permease
LFSGFFNGIIAYGVSFIHSHLESWRILFLIEGLMTILIAVIALIVLPEKVETARWLNEEEKEYCQSCFDLNAHSTTPTDQQ